MTVDDDQTDPEAARYEPPAVQRLGSLAEVTGGFGSSGGDFADSTGSFPT